jgi:hypothetical protein
MDQRHPTWRRHTDPRHATGHTEPLAAPQNAGFTPQANASATASSGPPPTTAAVSPSSCATVLLAHLARTQTGYHLRHPGSVSNPWNVPDGHSTRISGSQPAPTLDFGQDGGSMTTLPFTSSGVAEREAPYASALPSSTCTGRTSQLHYAWRDLTMFLDMSGPVGMNGVSLNFTAAHGSPARPTTRTPSAPGRPLPRPQAGNESIACPNAHFGAPVDEVAESRCPHPPGDWPKRASRNGTCSAAAGQP